MTEDQPRMELVGDSQEGDLEGLAAAFGSPATQQVAARADQSGQGLSVGPGGQGSADTTLPPPGSVAGDDPAPGGEPQHLHLQPAARAFAVLCNQLGVEPHPELVRSLNTLPAGAFAELTPYRRLGQGGAVLNVPPDAQPSHIQALLALVTLCSAGADIDDSGGRPSGDTYLRTVHLDVSSHALTTAQLKEVLLEAPRRLKQCYMLESLELAGCQLAPDAIEVLRDWKVMKALDVMRRLVLTDNPLLGRSQQVQQQQRAAGSASGAGGLGAAAAGAAAVAGEFLGPRELWWLETRVLQAAPLQLLDLRRTGFSDAACAYLLYKLATYPLPTNVGAPQPGAPTHGGCRTTLECLKMGPPADLQHFKKETAECLAKLLEVAPRLQVVEVVGLAPEARPPLQLAWQQVQQRRGRYGYVVEGPDGSLRLVLMEDGGEVMVERQPMQHEPLQPPTPEPCAQQLDEPLAATELPNFFLPGEQPGGVQQRWQPQQQRLASFIESRPGGRAQTWGGRQQPPRAPGDVSRRPMSAGNSAPAAAMLEASARAAGMVATAPNTDGAGSDRGGRQRRSSVAAAAAAAAGEGAGPSGARQAARPAGQCRRRHHCGGGARCDEGRLYLGGAREDALPLWEDDLDVEDGHEGGEEDASMADGSEEEGVSNIVSEGDVVDSDEASINYQRELKKLIKKLKDKDHQAGRRAGDLKMIWEGVDYAYDRKRWQNPSKTRLDMIGELNALLELKEILGQHGLYYTFRFPKEQRQQVLSWRQQLQQDKVKAAAVLAAQASQEQLQQQHHHLEQGGRARKKLRKAADLEVEEMQDSDGGGSDGGDAVLAAATQRPNKRKQLVVEEGSDSERGEVGSGAGSDNGGGSAQQQGHAALLNQHGKMQWPEQHQPTAGDDGSRGAIPLQELQRKQQQQQQLPLQAPPQDQKQQEPHQEQQRQAKEESNEGGRSVPTVPAEGYSSKETIFRKMLVAAAATAAEAAVAQAMQSIALGAGGGQLAATAGSDTAGAAGLQQDLQQATDNPNIELIISDTEEED